MQVFEEVQKGPVPCDRSEGCGNVCCMGIDELGTIFVELIYHRLQGSPNKRK